MPDFLANANTWLQGVRHDQLTRDITYKRGSESVAIKASVGHTELESVDGLGARVNHQVRDFLIRASDLVFGGDLKTPDRQDTITEVFGGYEFVHQVVPIGPNDEHWRYSDPFRTTLRVHTKQISALKL